MALNRFPVDATASPFAGATLALVRPRLDNAGAQRRNADNVPLWEYDLTIIPKGRRPEILPVTAPSSTTPAYAPNCRVSIRGCVASHYSIRENGRVSDGISFSADAVTPVGQKND
ncbi:hypothetical protein KIH79_05470 [Bifidobacterium sp. 82T10]|uniref:Uncharacterized protein n=1 Tax=Bifidobacterium miconis TaxID=2834435 RepID=A0ABS6WEE2_9BIFI|nr:hypothetical protein [Bifidobacterium miconis]MBW3092400.1 hypothetical protein [Bifidobacterium miconis]